MLSVRVHGLTGDLRLNSPVGENLPALDGETVCGTVRKLQCCLASQQQASAFKPEIQYFVGKASTIEHPISQFCTEMKNKCMLYFNKELRHS